MELNYKITAAASRWAIMYTLFAIGLAISAGEWLNQNASTPESLRGVCPALVALGTCVLIASKTIRGHHAKDVAEGKQAVKDKEFAEKVANTAVQLTNEAKEAYNALQSQVGELQAGHEQLAKECEHLRKSERSYIEKLQAQSDDLVTTEKEMILTAEKFATMKKELMTAKDKLMTTEKDLMTAKDECNKLKSSPLLELGSMCLEYRNLRSLGATNGINRDNEAKRGEYSQKAKELNVKINEHIEGLV